MAETLIIGSGNQDKARELAALLADLPWEVKGLGDFPPTPSPEETGATCEENALLKARYYADALGAVCAADDSGLEVDALDGAPGVYSARYAGPDCSYDDNNHKLLEALADTPWHERTARFVSCAAIAWPDGESHVVRGEVAGHISMAPYGDNGFGYDPVFVPEGHERTFAEMMPAEKNAMSHRGRAFRALRDWLAARA